VTVRTPTPTKVSLALLVVCCAIAAPAAAAPPGGDPSVTVQSNSDGQSKARAQALLSEGTAAYGRGDYASALEKFTAAYKIFPSPKLWFNIGQANRDLGRPVEAVEAFDRFLTEAEDAPSETLAEARRSAAELKTKLGQLKVTCPTDGAEITVDGKQVGSAPLGNMIWTTPGRHQVAAQQEGFSPAIADVVAVAGQAVTVNLDLRAIDLRAANEPAEAALVAGSAAPAPEETPLYRRGWFWIAVGAAVAAGAAAAVILATRDGGGGGSSNIPETTLGAQRTF
jgi:tetratricopeptide (TPR) repeat protein